MSVKALSAVFEDSRADGAAFTVLIAMADWADHNGRCYPSYAQIMRKARLRSRSTVLAALRQLEDLGEIERESSAHAPTRDDDDVPAPVARQHRNVYRILLLRRKPADEGGSSIIELPRQEGGSSVIELPVEPEVVRSVNTGSSIIEPEVVRSADTHIRNSPSVQTVSRPSGTAAAADDENEREIEVLRILWNDSIDRSSRIPVVSEITASRRPLVLKALKERPCFEWQAIFAKVASSSYLGGSKGFVANLWWLLGDVQRAIDVLDGMYDDHVGEAELEAAAQDLFRAYGAGGCPHRPTCERRDMCVRRWAVTRRQRRASA